MISLLDAMLCTLQKVDSCKEKSQAEEAKRHENQARYCKEYRVKIEHELLGTCREVLNLLNGRQGGATLLLCNVMRSILAVPGCPFAPQRISYLSPTQTLQNTCPT